MITPKEKYYELIKNSNISNILDELEVSYTTKARIITDLLKTYTSEQINFALDIYQNRYIAIKRYTLSHIDRTLISIIKRYDAQK
jgi:hypothetical protein